MIANGRAEKLSLATPDPEGGMAYEVGMRLILGIPIFHGVRGMWGGIDSSGLIDAKLQAMVNRRVAYLNGCEF